MEDKKTPATNTAAAGAAGRSYGTRPPAGRGGPGGQRGPGGQGGQAGRGGQRGFGNRGGQGGRDREPREFEQKILELSRVTRVTKGGKRMRFRAAVLIGDKKGKVGFGVAKAGDVAMAVEKAVRQAKKTLFIIPLVNGTIPHDASAKFSAAEVIIKPAPQGTGLKCGGPVRMVLDLAGVPNAVSKIMGSNNKINNAKATFMALQTLKVAAPKAKVE